MAATGQTAANVEKAIARTGKRRICTEDVDPTSRAIERAISDRFAQRAARNTKLVHPKQNNDTRDRWDKVLDTLAPKPEPEPEPVPALNSSELLRRAIAGTGGTINRDRAVTDSAASVLRNVLEQRQSFIG